MNLTQRRRDAEGRDLGGEDSENTAREAGIAIPTYGRGTHGCP